MNNHTQNNIIPKINNKSYEKESIIRIYGEYDSKCNYCKSSQNSCISYGINASKISVNDYQNLIDKGWRRLGSWIYHPNNTSTCCPNYTIRLDVNKFHKSKSQRKCLNRWNRYICYGKIKNKEQMDIDNNIKLNEKQNNCIKSSFKKEIEQVLFEALKLALSNYNPELSKIVRESGIKPKVTTILHKRKRGAFKNNLTCNFCLQLTPHAPKDYSPTNLAEKIIQYLPFHWKASASSPGFINFKYPKTKSFYKQQKSNNVNIHKMETDYNINENYHKFEIKMESASFSKEKFELFKLYQVQIHNESENEQNEDAFRESLCNSPLIHSYSSSSKTIPSCGYGSFHQLYYIDNELIAIGVIDILPKCLSSVYFFYNPKYSWLSPGVISALQEINWIKNIINTFPKTKIQYYYMGYYIHDCTKMKYKKFYQPSDLLCPITNKWAPLHMIENILENNQRQFYYTKQHLLSQKQKMDICDNCKIMLNNQNIVNVKDLTKESKNIVFQKLENFINLIGFDVLSYIFIF